MMNIDRKQTEIDVASKIVDIIIDYVWSLEEDMESAEYDYTHEKEWYTETRYEQAKLKYDFAHEMSEQIKVFLDKRF